MGRRKWGLKYEELSWSPAPAQVFLIYSFTFLLMLLLLLLLLLLILLLVLLLLLFYHLFYFIVLGNRLHIHNARQRHILISVAGLRVLLHDE